MEYSYDLPQQKLKQRNLKNSNSIKIAVSPLRVNINNMFMKEYILKTAKKQCSGILYFYKSL